MTVHSESAPASAQDAIEELYRAHALGLVRFALMLTGDQVTAEDVVQEAFIGLYRRWHQIRDHASVLPYLRTAVVNGARSAHRSRKRAGLLRLPAEPPAWSAEAAALDGEDRRALHAAVSRLPRRQREVLALKYYLDLAEHEVAAILQISRGTVSTTAARALATLSKQLKEES
ncbi:MAG TPA: SigE family RNA polymerase sigma factor [Streptosporangiaceae bacterium]